MFHLCFILHLLGLKTIFEVIKISNLMVEFIKIDNFDYYYSQLDLQCFTISFLNREQGCQGFQKDAIMGRLNLLFILECLNNLFVIQAQINRYCLQDLNILVNFFLRFHLDCNVRGWPEVKQLFITTII